MPSLHSLKHKLQLSNKEVFSWRYPLDSGVSLPKVMKNIYRSFVDVAASKPSMSFQADICMLGLQVKGGLEAVDHHEFFDRRIL
jgi:hypothetical protein